MSRDRRTWTVWSYVGDGAWSAADVTGTREDMEDSARWYRERGSDVVARPVGEVPDGAPPA